MLDTKFHISLDVNDLEQSVRFYSLLFNAQPAKLKPGYAKFELDQPGLVLTLEQGSPCCVSGVSHLGLRVASTTDVLVARSQLRQAGLEVTDEMNTTCCYAVQDKIWVTDPTGYRWEIYAFKGDSDVESAAPAAQQNETVACCEPSPAGAPCCEPAATARAANSTAAACCAR